MFVKSDSIVGRGKRDKLLDFAIFQVAMVPISRLGCLGLHQQHCWSKVTMFCNTSTVQVYFPHHEWIYVQAKTLQFLSNFFSTLEQFTISLLFITFSQRSVFLLTLCVCLLVCLYLTFCQFRKRKMVQS